MIYRLERLELEWMKASYTFELQTGVKLVRVAVGEDKPILVIANPVNVDEAEAGQTQSFCVFFLSLREGQDMAEIDDSQTLRHLGYIKRPLTTLDWDVFEVIP